jgi:hypothetical protein
MCVSVCFQSIKSNRALSQHRRAFRKSYGSGDSEIYAGRASGRFPVIHQRLSSSFIIFGGGLGRLRDTVGIAFPSRGECALLDAFCIASWAFERCADSALPWPLVSSASSSSITQPCRQPSSVNDPAVQAARANDATARHGYGVTSRELAGFGRSRRMMPRPSRGTLASTNSTSS